jgi:hypothetical protein
MATALPHSGGTLLARGSIDITGLYCVPCSKRGHTCYAHNMVDGEAQCVFCQDGEPCANDRRTKIHAPAPAAAPLKQPLERGIRALAKSLLASGLSESEVRGALRNQGYSPRAVDAVLPKPSPAPPPAPKGKTKMHTAVKSNGQAADPPAVRLCKCDCGQVVPAENRFAYIKGHMKRARWGVAAPKAKRRRPRKISVVPAAGMLSKRATEIAAPVPAAPPRHALEVTEAQLDRFLERLQIEWEKFVLTLPAEFKLGLVNHYLRSEPDAMEPGAAA